MKKKLGMVLIALCLLVCLISCTGGSEELAGTEWYCEILGISTKTLKFSRYLVTESITHFGVPASLVPDSYSYYCDMNTLEYNDQVYEMELDGDYLYLTKDDVTSTYVRVK